MSKKRQVLEILKRDCVNSHSVLFIEEYIENISKRNVDYAMKNKELGMELFKVQRMLGSERKTKLEVSESESISKLKQQLETKENENKRLNLDAQKWFDIAIDLLHGKTKPEDYK